MRCAVLLAVIGALLFQAGPPVDSTPWSRLEISLNQLGVQEINYQGYCFLPEKKLDAGRLDQWINQSRPPKWQVRLLVIDSGNGLPEEEAIRVLQVAGGDHRACWRAFQQQFVSGKIPENPVVWMAEALLDGDCSDMPLLAEELLAGLAGKPHSIYRDECTINILAYAPGFKSQLIMEGAPVNLNLELRYNRNLGLIRIRAGVPLLISGLKA